jgi:sulfur carrier protein
LNEEKMKIFLNGKDTIIQNNSEVLNILLEYNLSPKTVIVELNKKVLVQEEINKTILKENDKLEVLRFVGGG